MNITEKEKDEFEVECPKQKVKAEKTRKRFRACFKKEICSECKYKDNCPTQKLKTCRVYYFDRNTYLRNKRKRKLYKIPEERRKLRPNVEATVKEFKTPLNHKGKLRVRGLIKTMIYAYGAGIGINLGRIHRYIVNNPELPDYFKILKNIIISFHFKIVLFFQNGNNVYLTN